MNATPAEQDQFDAAIQDMDLQGIDPVGMGVRDILAYGAVLAGNTGVEALQPAIAVVRLELKRTYTLLGLPRDVPTLTGNMLLVEEAGAVWFEIKSTDGRSTQWVTADMAGRAELGQLLVTVDTCDEALAYDESN